MYINDIHILEYLFVGILGLFVGQLIDWCNIRLEKYQRIISKDFKNEYAKTFTPRYLLMTITAILYIAVLFRYNGINIESIKYMILIPMLINVFVIDIKSHIVPNRLTLTMLECGLIITFLQVIINTNIGINTFVNNILGMAIGGISFLILTFIGNMFTQKDTMGFGDVKLMTVLGLVLGKDNIIIVIILSFILATIIGLINLLVLKIRKKETSEYIAFGPYIAIASMIVIFVPFEFFINLLSIVVK